MKRRVVVIGAVFLVVGAVVNISVALASAAFAPHPFCRGLRGVQWIRSDNGRRFTKIAGYECRAERGFGSAWGLSIEQYAAPGRDPWTGSGVRYTADVYRVGWPWAAGEWCDCVWPTEDKGGLLYSHSVRVFGLPIWGVRESWRRLPLTVLWPGAIGNTLLYGGGLGAVVCGPRALRRWRRARRGLCVACGYDLRGLRDGVVCPECGAAVAAPPRPVEGPPA